MYICIGRGRDSDCSIYFIMVNLNQFFSYPYFLFFSLAFSSRGAHMSEILLTRL